MSDRKATEVLLDLEHKVDLILRYIQVLDVNVKLILNKSLSNDVSDNVVPLFKSEVKKEDAPALTVESFTQVSDSTVRNIISATDVNTLVKRRHIHQNVIYAIDNKNVVLAKVIAYDKDKNKVGETKTNMHGKWKLSLRPGEYTIHLVKTGTKAPPRPPIDLRYNIVVENIENNQLENMVI